MMAGQTLTLLGPDVMLVAMGEGQPNNAVLAVECGGRLDVERIARASAALLPHAPYMSSRLERPFPWGRLRWRAVDGPPPVVRRTLQHDESIADVIDAVLNTTIDLRREPPLHWLMVESADAASAWLLLAWAHPLMDPRGAELLLAMLDGFDRGGEARSWAMAQRVEPPVEERDRRPRAQMARRALAHLQALGREPSRPLGRGVARAGRVRHRRVVVPATPRHLPSTLAAVGSAMATLWRERGFALDQNFLVPISVDRRRKGEPGPVFGNYLSFHFARFTPAAATDRAGTAAALRRDMAQAVRDDMVEAVWAGMSMARYSPAAQLLRPFAGEGPASFHYADTGEVRLLPATLCDAPVRAAYHVPCVQRRPGLGVFFSRWRENESVVAVWVDSVVSADEVDRLLAVICAGIAAA